MKFSICYINRNNDVANACINKSLSKLDFRDDYEVLFLENKNNEYSPSFLYNRFIDIAQGKYLILSHEDMKFPPNILESIEKTIDQVDDDFGVLGAIGRNSHKQYCFSEKNRLYEVDTHDPCFIVIKREKDFRFDEVEFNEFHLYVEDYCARKIEQNKKNYTLLEDIYQGDVFNEDLENKNDMLIHFANTIKNSTYCWGNYFYYKNKFVLKYPQLHTT